VQPIRDEGLGRAIKRDREGQGAATHIIRRLLSEKYKVSRHTSAEDDHDSREGGRAGRFTESV
jgi:hypothetical protein